MGVLVSLAAFWIIGWRVGTCTTFDSGSIRAEGTKSVFVLYAVREYFTDQRFAQIYPTVVAKLEA